jgi:hypothetical protein
MILTYVNAGTSGPDGINYLFSERDANGKLRNPPAELFEGDLFLTKCLIQHNHRSQKYSSYALSFRNNESVTDDQLKEILQSLRDTFCTGLGPDRVNMLAVKHTDKSNIELHIIINNEEFGITGKQFNPFPPGERSKKLQQDFCSYWNHKLGFEQVVSNPFKAAFSRFDAKAPAYRKEEYSKALGNDEVVSSKERKEKLSYIVTKAVMDGKINNRDGLISFLEERGCKITRRGADYLSIRLPGKDKAIRFRGGAFVENVDYRALIAEHNTAAKHLTSYQFRKIKENLNSAMKYKRELHARIYAPKKPRMPKDKRLNSVSSPSVKPSSKNIMATKPKENAQVSAKHSSKPQIQNNNQVPRTSTPSISSSGSNESMMISIGSLGNKIYALGVKLSQAPIEQRVQIQNQIASLRLQLTRLQQRAAEAKKAELNRTNPIKPKLK